jgi:iron complex transport system ATP-binding protein
VRVSRPTSPVAGAPLIDLRDVTVLADGRKILGPLSWRVEADEHWVILGPNGGGKSTLMAVASLGRHPSEGSVRVLGHELGRVDVRDLRSRVGVASAALVDQLRGRLTAAEVVKCGLHAALEPWWHTYTAAEAERAGELLARVGLAGYDDRTLATLSTGERQRTLLARTLMADPDLVLLDEPTAGLDLGGREALVAALDGVAADGRPATVFVTHHVEDIPRSTTHLLALHEGRPMAAGPVDEVLTAELLGAMFGIEVELGRRDGRWSARAG